MSQTTAKRSVSLWVFVLLGAVFLVTFAGVAGWKLFDRFQHGRDWRPTAANVTWTGDMCQMAYKSGKSWKNADVVDCNDVNAYEAAAPDRNWRSTVGPFATVAYDASGARQEVLLPVHRVSEAPVATGNSLEVFVDPDDPLRIDRALTGGDYREAALLIGLGIATMLLTIVVGSFVLRANERLLMRKAAAGGIGTTTG